MKYIGDQGTELSLYDLFYQEYDQIHHRIRFPIIKVGDAYCFTFNTDTSRGGFHIVKVEVLGDRSIDIIDIPVTGGTQDRLRITFI